MTADSLCKNDFCSASCQARGHSEDVDLKECSVTRMADIQDTSLQNTYRLHTESIYFIRVNL
jgi:hypothetical protein